MKKRIIRTLALAALLATGLVSCSKSSVPASKGDSVLFSGGIGRSESGSKTAYAGDNASSSDPEGINWSEGDEVRIWCAECSEPTTVTYGKNDHFADYTVTPGESSAGSLTVDPNTVGLRWGDAGTTHHFYAVYPSPKTKDKSAGEFGTNPSSFTFTGHIPATQGIASYTAGDLSVAAPDMSNLYMVSKTDATPNDGGEGVFLKFTPLTTAIEFTITNGLSGDKVMNVKSVSLKSASHNLCGAFSTTLSGEWTTPSPISAPSGSGINGTYTGKYPACTEGATDMSKAVSIDFTDTDAYKVGIANGKTLRFTFFLLPTQSVDDLYLTIKRDDKSLKTKLSMADGTGIPFPAHKKAYVKGIIVPDGAGESLKFTATVAEWGASEYSQDMPMTKRTGPDPDYWVDLGMVSDNGKKLYVAKYDVADYDPETGIATFQTDGTLGKSFSAYLSTENDFRNIRSEDGQTCRIMSQNEMWSFAIPNNFGFAHDDANGVSTFTSKMEGACKGATVTFADGERLACPFNKTYKVGDWVYYSYSAQLFHTIAQKLVRNEMEGSVRLVCETDEDAPSPSSFRVYVSRGGNGDSYTFNGNQIVENGTTFIGGTGSNWPRSLIMYGNKFEYFNYSALPNKYLMNNNNLPIMRVTDGQTQTVEITYCDPSKSVSAFTFTITVSD